MSGAPRLDQRCLLRPEDIPPSREGMEVIGVFNPGVVGTPEGVFLMARVAERPSEQRPGWIALPRWSPGEEVVVDWIREEDLRFLDPRVVEIRRTGLIRLTFLSHLVVLRSRDGRSFPDISGERFFPDGEYEEYGVEDPRITKIGETYYITYVSVSRHGAATSLATTRDFKTFRRHGILFHPENKDVVLFPEKIDGEYVALHRPNAATPFCQPEMWLARSPDLIHWGKHRCLAGGFSDWDSGRVGAGIPPFRVREGWIEIYHGNRAPSAENEVGEYSAGVFLLDPKNPETVLRRSPDPILVPEAEFERHGFVPGVVFPTGVVQEGDRLLIYYGAADRCVGLVEVTLDSILSLLE